MYQAEVIEIVIGSNKRKNKRNIIGISRLIFRETFCNVNSREIFWDFREKFWNFRETFCNVMGNFWECSGNYLKFYGNLLGFQGEKIRISGKFLGIPRNFWYFRDTF